MRNIAVPLPFIGKIRIFELFPVIGYRHHMGEATPLPHNPSPSGIQLAKLSNILHGKGFGEPLSLKLLTSVVYNENVEVATD